MKLETNKSRAGGLFAAALVTFASFSAHAAITVDGIRDTINEIEYAELAVQATTSNWSEGGGQEALANIHAGQDGNTLAIHLAARVSGRGIILFIDSKSGGRTFISNPLITFGGEDNYINNLGFNMISGMTFETGFTPDYAIRIYGDGGTGAFVNTYDLIAGTRTEAGNAGVAMISSGFISQMRADSLGTVGTVDSANYSAATKGVEMKLDLAALGVSSGSQSVKVMAVLVNTDSNYGSNQVLASRTSTTDDIAGAINSINFQTESDTQTLTIPVTGPDSREVVFSVNMNDEITKGFFNAATDRVKVLFFSGLASPTPGEIFLTDENSDGTYIGSLVATGAENDLFGTYKFFNTRGTPLGGFEYGANRNFDLGALNFTQNLPTVTFRGNSFALWSAEFSDGQSATEDRDGDGIENILEYFMGGNNSQFTPNPSPVSGAVSWPRDPFATGVDYRIWISETLATGSWMEVTDDADLISQPGFIKYTLPTTAPKLFVRLEVFEE